MNCLYCNKILSDKQVNNGRKFCSLDCSRHGKKKSRLQCLFCGKECKRSTTKFCSRSCDNKYRSKNNIRRGGPKKEIEIRKCLSCFKDFLPHKLNQRFCSIFCCSTNSELRDKKKIGGQKNKGKHHTEETRKKMSESATLRMASSSYTRGVGGYRKDIGFYVRSRWEANIARILNLLNVCFYYENDKYILSFDNHQITYIPDFKIVENIYIEVKGWWNQKSKNIREAIKKQYPEVLIYYISETEYIELQQKYSGVISEWEFKKYGGKKCTE